MTARLNAELARMYRDANFCSVCGHTGHGSGPERLDQAEGCFRAVRMLSRDGLSEAYWAWARWVTTLLRL